MFNKTLQTLLVGQHALSHLGARRAQLVLRPNQDPVGKRVVVAGEHPKHAHRRGVATSARDGGLTCGRGTTQEELQRVSSVQHHLLTGLGLQRSDVGSPWHLEGLATYGHRDPVRFSGADITGRRYDLTRSLQSVSTADTARLPCGRAQHLTQVHARNVQCFGTAGGHVCSLLC